MAIPAAERASYQLYKSHAEAFAVFANQVEALNQMDVEVYHFDVVHERKVESEAGEIEGPKKFADSPPEGAELIETPVMMRRVVSVIRSSAHSVNHLASAVIWDVLLKREPELRASRAKCWR